MHSLDSLLWRKVAKGYLHQDTASENSSSNQILHSTVSLFSSTYKEAIQGVPLSSPRFAATPSICLRAPFMRCSHSVHALNANQEQTKKQQLIN